MANNYSKDVFKPSQNREKKTERYSRDSLTKEKIGKAAKFALANGQEIQGRLLEVGMYDILVQTTQGILIILKSGILTVEVS